MIPPLATQFASQRSQAEQGETEQRDCGAAIGNRSPSDDEREVLVRSIPPRPFVGAGRDAELDESCVVISRAVRQSATGQIAGRHKDCPSELLPDLVSAATGGNRQRAAPQN